MARSNSVRVGWWNTGLAPPRGRPRGTVANYAKARTVVGSLLNDCRVDILALGETTETDVESLVPRPRARRWAMPNAPRERATSLSIIYDASKLVLQDGHQVLRDAWGRHSYTTGWHLVFQLVEGGDELNVVVVHWPSRIRDAAERRRDIGAALHRKLRHSRDVLLLGDFNDEPFSASLTYGLRAYRDRDLVRKEVEAFYNPFWRRLGEQEHVEHQAPERQRLPPGTHFYRSGDSTRWFTVDQIVVSSAMLGRSSWRLVESQTGILAHDALLTRNCTTTGIFDHLPVVGSLDYHSEGAEDG